MRGLEVMRVVLAVRIETLGASQDRRTGAPLVMAGIHGDDGDTVGFPYK